MLAALLATAACHITMAHGLPAPDNAWSCTPGSYTRLTRTEACTPKTRPTLKAADRRQILAEYGVPNWTGSDGELDHRQPVWLGGRTEPANVWPERGSIPNEKDRLESYVYRRVCTGKPRPMRLRTARRVFAADWRHAYRAWHEDGEL